MLPVDLSSHELIAFWSTIRTLRFAILGMSLSAVFDNTNASDLLKTLLNILAEYDQSRDENYNKPKMVRMYVYILLRKLIATIPVAILSSFQSIETTSWGHERLRYELPRSRRGVIPCYSSCCQYLQVIILLIPLLTLILAISIGLSPDVTLPSRHPFGGVS